MNPRPRSQKWTAPLFGFAFAALWLVPAIAGADGDPVDLAGNWFVLIHYRDSATANPEADRWEDKVWSFQRENSRLRWTEYPIVVFEEDEGRFGPVGRNPNARLLRAWEPNEAQRLEIARGLQVNPRGSKSKSLRGSPESDYRSTHRPQPTSAMTISYREIWSIDDPTEKPVFTRDDRMGTGAALATGDREETLYGRTRYTTLEVSNEGNLLTGSYTRDETRVGTFRMLRTGPPRKLGRDDRNPSPKF